MSSENTPSFELAGSIWFRSGTLNWGNPRRMALLAAIHEHGSISAAARHIDLSYKAAWDAIDTMNNLADEPLVLRTTGGQRGGGASLTPKALEILELYQQLDAVHQRFMNRLAKAKPGSDKNLELLQTMMVQTSARNNFSGMVSKIALGAVNAEVSLDIGGAQPIIASITRESVESMGLKKGMRALAFLKASSIIVALPSEGKLSARNQLEGTVVNVEAGAVNAEVGLEISDKHRITAIITMESLERLQLKVGQRAVAIFKASSVLLGTID
ncbi:MAG TPA: TOBE domain-containing protein [Paenalcaligenes hominis]|uniref:Molybdate transport system regulatory protein n=1 Tax=Paenalcaligenes hominis TaxID=643674 RepID=A0A9D3ABT8_9BURK|nr:TOBE domain-containing protein [Paenalcaligenes hominis]NJB64678.1 molybdate transport system regulatory protein [Paenalcaligenes hominis]GGE59951.1 ModE family transcriptional regulator [Paenalcaligenes hominis]HJH24559.1 TOBE domain-containing protein [Paenalcaligenes hominis]